MNSTTHTHTDKKTQYIEASERKRGRSLTKLPKQIPNRNTTLPFSFDEIFFLSLECINDLRIGETIRATHTNEHRFVDAKIQFIEKRKRKKTQTQLNVSCECERVRSEISKRSMENMVRQCRKDSSSSSFFFN